MHHATLRLLLASLALASLPHLALAAISAGPSVVVAPHQVTVTWTTDASATTELHWGPAPSADETGYPNHATSGGLVGTKHSQTLSNLAPGTWYLRARSVDGGGTPSLSAEQVVTVTAAGAPLGSFVLDGDVLATARSADRLYFGGTFTEVGVRRGNGVAVDPSTGLVAEHRPMVAGSNVYAAVPDGSGGLFVAGDFTHVGGLRRDGAAHLLPDGGVDPDWAPSFNGIVRALDVAGSTVYLVGDFTLVDGQARRYAAAVDAVTGAVAPWDPALDGGGVLAVKAAGSMVYVGGYFLTVGGSVRNFAAAVDATTGALAAWAPAPNAAVFSIAVSGTTVYLGGYFNQLQGATPRSRAAAVDATTGAPLAWDPDLDGVPYAIAVSGSTVYLGGAFQAVKGATRNRAAAVNATTGALLAWNPDLDGQVNALALSGGTVYLGGSFTTAGGATPRRRAVAVDASSGAMSSWNPAPNGTLNAIAPTANGIFLGGGLTSANPGIVRNRAAAIDLTTGTLEPWDPDLNGDVAALAVAGPTVYLGGAFTTAAGGTVRNRAAAVSGADAGLLAWNPDVNGRVNALAVVASTVYLGGFFGQVNVGGVPQTRSYLAAVDATTGTAMTWNPIVYAGGTATNRGVKALAASATTLYVGGLFDHVGGAAGTVRNCGAAFDLATGSLGAWNPDFNTTGLTDRVEALAVDGATVYAGGYFTHVKTVSRSYVVAVDATSGVPTPWSTSVDNEVRSIAVSGEFVFLGGHFGRVMGIAQQGVAAVTAATGGRADWNPGLAGYGPRSIDVDCAAGRLVLGGLFTAVGSVPQRGLAALDAFVCPPANSAPTAAAQELTVDEDVSVSITLSGSDPNGDPLTYAVVSGPAKGSLSGSGAARTYVPSQDSNGDDSFTFTASDGAATSTPVTVTIHVTPVNDAPVLQPVGARSAEVGQTLNFTAVGSDVDGDPLTYTATGLPAGATLDPTTGVLAWTPGAGDVGDHAVTIAVTDGTLQDEEAVTLTVTQATEEAPSPGGCGCRGGEGGAASLLLFGLLAIAGARRRARSAPGHETRPVSAMRRPWSRAR